MSASAPIPLAAAPHPAAVQKPWSPQIKVVATSSAVPPQAGKAAAVGVPEDDNEDLYAENYYGTKSSGAGNRTAGMKLRPDEAKRKDAIVTKKDTQRVKNM